VFDSLVDLATSSSWTYAVLFAFAAGDAVAPILPSETLVVAAAALAASGSPHFGLVLAAAAPGAVAGDNLGYLIGRFFGERVRAWAASRRKAKQRLELAARQLERRGGTIIVMARFVPGGRTATMLAAGVVSMRWRRFLLLDLAAAIVWALYCGLIGFFGGTAFEDEPLVGVAFALGLALVLGALGEGARRVVLHLRSRG
jgi:membrane protein DedA with SNARE-associated domain